jgi:acyl-CoA reductase-like NAD-dependent aldehyde dehydrogenase
MKKPPKKQLQIIAPNAYPQVLSKPNAARAAKTLRSAQTAERAQAAMEAQVPAMRAAILEYVEELEKAQGDMALIFAKAHEIRGFAETAGLVTTGRIAEILCRYMDDMERIKKPLDTTLVALNVSAIGRAARIEDGDAATGDMVAAELAALVARRLSDAGPA